MGFEKTWRAERARKICFRADSNSIVSFKADIVVKHALKAGDGWWRRFIRVWVSLGDSLLLCEFRQTYPFFSLTYCIITKQAARLSTTTSFRRQSQQPKRVAFTVRAADGDDKKEEAAADEFTGLKYTKASEFANMSNEQILAEVAATKKMLYSLRVKQSTRKAFKGHHFDILRKKVAQLYTVRRQREVAEGVSKRDSREIMRQERKTNMYI